MEFDLAIIGSGGAGFAAAIAAAKMELSVVMVERSTIGGTCVNVGCIPSKTLLAAAEASHTAAGNAFPGTFTSAESPDMSSLVAGKSEIVDLLRRERYEELASEYGWKVLKARGRFAAGPVLEVEGRRVEASHYLIATGASPWVPPIPGLEEAGYLTSTTAMELERLPSSLIVVGGNYVGLELGQMFARLGCSVTILEALPRVAASEEPEISESIEAVLEDEGIRVIAPAKPVRVSRIADEVVVTLEDGNEVRAEEILMATGRRPNSSGLGLEDVGVEIGHLGAIQVDATLRTANARIWAAGDVTGAPQFVYVAGSHGRMVVENAFLGTGQKVNYSSLPRVTFTSPNIAAVGLTEAEVTRAGSSCISRVLPLSYVPRAVVNRDTRGVVKIVADPGTRRVLGIHMVGPNAGECILAATYALEAAMTIDQLASTWAPYLTMAEAIKLAAQSFNTDVSKLSCCAS